jgi:hypothetical protein
MTTLLTTHLDVGWVISEISKQNGIKREEEAREEEGFSGTGLILAAGRIERLKWNRKRS